MNVKVGSFIVLRIGKITYGKDGYVYISLETPTVSPPYVNVPTLRVEPSKLQELEKLTFNTIAEFLRKFGRGEIHAEE